MQNQNKEKVVYPITEEMIQCEAEQEIDRELSEAELEQVVDCLYDEGEDVISVLIRESINKTIELNELEEKGFNAYKSSPHFKLYHKNANAFQPEFEPCGIFETLKEAKRYRELNWNFMDEFDQWKITIVNEHGESDVEIIGEGKPLTM